VYDFCNDLGSRYEVPYRAIAPGICGPLPTPRGDTMAEKMFVGSDCELCKPPSKWTIQKKMLD
jgi:hypothetical protein